MPTLHTATPPGRPRIGLALGSGGARGWAHLGVLRRLQELQVPIDCVAGTSIGAIMGAALAANRLPVLEELTHQLDWRRVAKLVLEGGFPRTGLLSGKFIEQLLRAVLELRHIEELTIPYAAVAANLQTGQPTIFTSGDIVEAVRASIAIPGIFVPARSDDQYLVDGGTINPLPIEVARALGAEIVIAVDVNLGPGRGLPPDPQTPRHVAPATAHAVAAILHQLGEPRPVHGAVAQAIHRWFARETAGLSIFDVLTRSARIAENQNTHHLLQLHPPTLLIQPAVGDIETLEFNLALHAMAAGRQAVDDSQPQLLALCHQCAANQSGPDPISTSSGTPRSKA
jgi:NTE family protein